MYVRFFSSLQTRRQELFCKHLGGKNRWREEDLRPNCGEGIYSHTELPFLLPTGSSGGRAQGHVNSTIVEAQQPVWGMGGGGTLRSLFWGLGIPHVGYRMSFPFLKGSPCTSPHRSEFPCRPLLHGHYGNPLKVRSAIRGSPGYTHRCPLWVLWLNTAPPLGCIQIWVATELCQGSGWMHNRIELARLWNIQEGLKSGRAGVNPEIEKLMRS